MEGRDPSFLGIVCDPACVKVPTMLMNVSITYSGSFCPGHQGYGDEKEKQSPCPCGAYSLGQAQTRARPPGSNPACVTTGRLPYLSVPQSPSRKVGQQQ